MRNKVMAALLAAVLAAGNVGPVQAAGQVDESPALQENEAVRELPGQTPEDARGVTYEIFVGSFADSDGDGVGDLRGIEEHLDYINDGDDSTTDDLGCNAIWMTPIFKSPTYHKYDAADYETIDPDFGTMEDFDSLLAACHERGIRLYLDLAVNHTSTDHAWFQQAADYLKTLKAGQVPDPEACPYADYYNFSDKAQEGYAQLAGTDWYYEARFWEGMPDLNLSSDAVKDEIAGITRFWLDKGIDGFRLDALTSYYTDSKSESVSFLKWLVDTVKTQDPGAYLVGECWADEATIADYYDSGIDSLFDFPFAGQDGTIATAVRGGNKALSWAQAMAGEEMEYASRNASFINAPFYTNHDMARSAGYYSYDDGTKTKLAAGMNLLMTGNAFVYYGEEIGLKGSGKDENKRAPMLWTSKEADEGAETETEGDAAVSGSASSLYDASAVTAGPEDMDPVESKYGSAEDQTGDPASILSYYREAIRLRNSFPAIARGNTTVIESLSSNAVAVFSRTMDSLPMAGGTEAADTAETSDAEASGTEAIDTRTSDTEAKAGAEDSVLVVVNTGEDDVTIDLGCDEAAKEYKTLAAALNARTTVSSSASSSRGSRGRRSSSESEAEAASPAPGSSLDGTVVTVPAYGIAVLTK